MKPDDKALLKFWEDALEAEGLGVLDIEKLPQGRKGFWETSAYFDRVNEILHTYSFATNTDYQVWLMHSEGKTVRETAQALNLNKARVSATLMSIREKHGLPKQYLHVPPKAGPVTATESQALNLHAEGLPDSAIAKALDLPSRHIAKNRRKAAARKKSIA